MRAINIKQFVCATVAVLLFAACANDELMEGTVQDLPEGMYPLQIASVSVTAGSSAERWGVNAPQTRVSEKTDGRSSQWDWNGTEKIGMMFYEDEVSYTLNSDKTLTADKILYWKNKSQLDVTAWYPANGRLDLSYQSEGLKYVMKGSGTGSYNSPVVLSFTHQLAKIRVKLTGDKASDVISVSVKGYTQCTVCKGEVSISDFEKDYISMKKPVANDGYWEANVIPGAISTTGFLKVNERPLDVETTFTQWDAETTYIQLDAAKYYDFEVEVMR